MTPNDSTLVIGDDDTGPNNLQNYPILTGVRTGSSTTITGTLDSGISQTFRVEFFWTDALNPEGVPEGQHYIGFANEITDANGFASFNATFAGVVPGDAVVTATATDPEGNTSEFSTGVANVVARVNGSTLVVAGTNLPDKLSVTASGDLYIVKSGGKSKTFSKSAVKDVQVFALAGNDVVSIGAGVPTTFVDAGLGNDWIGAEEDYASKLSCSGAGGSDTIIGGSGDDELSGGNGKDRIIGAAGNDYLIGGAQPDVLYGQAGNDVCSGAGGNDWLFGDGGSDYLRGGAGNDHIDGRFLTSGLRDGTDSISGNAGDDTAVANGQDLLAGIETLQ